MHVVPGAFSEGGGGLEPTRGGQAPACVTISGTQWGLSSRTRHRPASMGSNRRGSQIGGCCVCGGSAWRRPASRAGMHHFPVLPLQVVLTPLFNFQPESPVRKESSGLALRTRGQVWDDGGSAPPGGLGEGGVIAASQRPLLAALGSKMGWGGYGTGVQGSSQQHQSPGTCRHPRQVHGAASGSLADSDTCRTQGIRRAKFCPHGRTWDRGQKAWEPRPSPRSLMTGHGGFQGPPCAPTCSASRQPISASRPPGCRPGTSALMSLGSSAAAPAPWLGDWSPHEWMCREVVWKIKVHVELTESLLLHSIYDLLVAQGKHLL